MPRHGNTVPCFTDHLGVVHAAAAALNQHPQRVQRLWSYFKLNPIPKQARSFGVKAEGPNAIWPTEARMVTAPLEFDAFLTPDREDYIIASSQMEGCVSRRMRGTVGS
jgi:hypothetical protein